MKSIQYSCGIKDCVMHQRLCHASASVLQHLVKSSLLSCNKITLGVCDFCFLAKSHKLIFSLSTTQATKPLQFVHYDVWAPSPVISHIGSDIIFSLLIDTPV
jgi:GAG-pre-integrase domain